jgi:site-specific recombinase XerD
VGKPFVATITPEEFERLLLACTPPKINNVITERAAARNQAMLLLFYDTGIRLSELIHLRLSDWNREQGIILVKGKGAKDRRIALGKMCQHYLCCYLDHHRPSDEELVMRGNPTEEHLFLSETYQPLSANGITLMLRRIKKRAGIQGKRISAHIFRHTFAIQYLVLGNDPFSLQYLLGHEDMATVKFYMHMNDATIQEQKRKYSPGDHLSIYLSH